MLDFYSRPALEVAPDLLGKYLVHEKDGLLLAGRIVEVEAYTGEEDKACHTYGGRITPRTKIMYLRGGHLYVYFIYGIHCLLNVVTGKEGDGEAVLIRGLEVVDEEQLEFDGIDGSLKERLLAKESLDAMALNRYGKKFNDLSKVQLRNFMDGPGKLSKALALDLSHNGYDLLDSEVYILGGNGEPVEFETSKRIGIDYAEEAADFLYRFTIKA